MSMPATLSHLRSGTRASRTTSLTQRPMSCTSGSWRIFSPRAQAAAIATFFRCIEDNSEEPWVPASWPNNLAMWSALSQTTQSTSLDFIPKPFTVLPKYAGLQPGKTADTTWFSAALASSTRATMAASGSKDATNSYNQSSPEASAKCGFLGTPGRNRSGEGPSRQTNAASRRAEAPGGILRLRSSASRTRAVRFGAWHAVRWRTKPSRTLKVANLTSHVPLCNDMRSKMSNKSSPASAVYQVRSWKTTN
mmetsp:Transcript_17909/g.49127  ORF Transcript_17909/g.49127 Transcript_17909/m.49127 type:complete len:250 (+) Transcript_17909:1459-2208(+)